MMIAQGVPVRPFLQRYTNAGNTFRQRIVNFGRDELPAAPDALRYRVDDLTNVAQVLGWTTVTPSSQQTLAISGSLNQMGWPYRDYQLNQISVERTYNATSTEAAYVQTETYVYTLTAVYQPGVNLPNLGP